MRSWFRPRPEEEAAARLYAAVVAQARQPVFYADLGVPDTAGGRIEMVGLHTFLVLNRLRAEHPRGAELGQALFDLMFADLDQSLRELGVGDMSIGKKVKKLAKGFYGRIQAYQAGLDSERPADLEEALSRNVYAEDGEGARNAGAALLAAYLRREAAALADQAGDAILAGEVRFGPAPEAPVKP